MDDVIYIEILRIKYKQEYENDKTHRNQKL